jgi:ABC-type multidrug transport system ATPase subunit
VVLVSTHLLEDVEGVADRVVVIHRGTAVFADTVEEFVRAGGGSDVTLASLRDAWTAAVRAEGHAE